MKGGSGGVKRPLGGSQCYSAAQMDEITEIGDEGFRLSRNRLGKSGTRQGEHPEVV